MKIITVIGSGTWGGALAMHLAKKGHIVYLCSTNENKAEIIRMHREIPNLPGVKLDNNIIVNKVIGPQKEEEYTLRFWISKNTLTQEADMHFHGIIEVVEDGNDVAKAN